jgi:hypothetical protein
MKVSPSYYPLKFVKIPTIFLPDFVTPNDIVIPANLNRETEMSPLSLLF